MIDKVQKIREEVERLKGWNNNVRNSTRHMTLQEEDFNRGKHSSYLEILDFIDSLQDEPQVKESAKVQHVNETCKENGNSLTQDLVSEDLEEASKEWLRPQLDKFYANYGEAKIMELTRFDGYAMLDAIEFGANWQKQQMMKNAVEAILYFDYGDISGFYGMVELHDIPMKDIEDGDKVKVIIIKED